MFEAEFWLLERGLPGCKNACPVEGSVGEVKLEKMDSSHNNHHHLEAIRVRETSDVLVLSICESIKKAG